jgi:hypothetical protein
MQAHSTQDRICNPGMPHRPKTWSHSTLRAGMSCDRTPLPTNSPRTHTCPRGKHRARTPARTQACRKIPPAMSHCKNRCRSCIVRYCCSCTRILFLRSLRRALPIHRSKRTPFRPSRTCRPCRPRGLSNRRGNSSRSNRLRRILTHTCTHHRHTRRGQNTS